MAHAHTIAEDMSSPNQSSMPAENDRLADEWTLVINRPALTILAAGALGLAVGVLVIRSRRNANRYSSVERSLELARSGTVRTFQNLRRRLREEGYSASQLQGRSKKYINRLLAAAAVK